MNHLNAPNCLKRVIPMLLAITLAGASTTWADTLTWQGTPSSFTWNLDSSSLNWSNSVGVLGPYADGNDVVFDDTAATNAVNITVAVKPNSITVNTATTNYVFLNGGGSIGGTTGLNMNGTGRFTISGANTFTGNTVVNSGMLVVGRTNALGVPNGSVTVNPGGTLDLRGFRLGLGIKELDVAGDGAMWTNGLQGALCSGVGSGSILGSSGGMNNIVLLGDTTFRADGRWDINGAPRGGIGFTGNGYRLTKLGANVIWFQNITNLGLGDIDVKEGALGFQGYPIDMGDPTKTITFWPGTVFDFWTDTNGLVKNMVMTNAELQAGSGSNNFNGPITLYGTNRFDVTSGKVLALQGAISGPGGFNKTTAGFLYLYGTNTYTGPTFISASGGRIIVGATSSLGNSSLIQLAAGTAVDVSAGSGLTLGSGQTLIGLGNHSIVGNLTNQAGSIVNVGNGAAGLLGVNFLSQTDSTNLMVLGANPFSVNGTVNSLIHVTNDLALSGVVTFQFAPVGLLDTNTPYTVLQYDGSLTSGGLANLRAVSSNPNYTFTFLDPATTAPYLEVQVSGNPIPLLWKGGVFAAPSTWDQTTANWLDASTSQSTTFINGDIVTFDDTAATNVVSVQGAISATMFCSNVNASYTFTGSGTLAGSVEQDTPGLVTLALSNAPTFSSIINNQGTLAFNLQSTNFATVAAAITDDGNGFGTIVQAGSNTLQLTGNNLGYNGTLVVTNGILQYGSYSSLGQYFAPLYVTNGGSLDFNDIDTVFKNIVVSGTGFNGAGALMDSSANTSVHAVINSMTLAGDTTISANGRWDLHGAGTVSGNGFNLTKIGGGQVWLPAAGDTGFKDINILGGVLGFQNQATLGDPTGTITASPGTIFGLWAEIPQLNKNLVLNGATFDSAGGSNNFAGTLTLLGNNNIVMRTDFGLACNIVGTGGFAAVTNDSLGSAAGHSLWLYGANTYTGPTFVRLGSRLVVASGSSLGNSSLVQIDAGGTLNLSAPVVLGLGAGQTVTGNGTILGGGMTFGTGSTLAVTATGGTLTMTGDLTFQDGSTNMVTISKTTNTSVVGLNSVTMGGTLVIANTGKALAGGDQFQLFSATNYSGTFTNIVPSTPGPGMAWDTSSLASNGALGVIATVNTTPTNIVAEVSGNGSQVTLSWPADHIGWTLQAQTNAPGVGLGTNWVNVAGSSATNQVVLPIDPNNGSVFFRMIIQ